MTTLRAEMTAVRSRNESQNHYTVKYGNWGSQASLHSGNAVKDVLYQRNESVRMKTHLKNEYDMYLQASTEINGYHLDSTM
jgi:hypothetical protein